MIQEPVILGKRNKDKEFSKKETNKNYECETILEIHRLT